MSRVISQQLGRPGDPVKSAKTFFCIAIFALCAALSPSGFSQVPSGREVVKPEVYASLEPAAAAAHFKFAVVMKIRPASTSTPAKNQKTTSSPRISRPPFRPASAAAKFLIPRANSKKILAFSKIPLNVYQDTVILRMPVTALADAPLGEQRIPLKLRYQACSSELCLHPSRLHLTRR